MKYRLPEIFASIFIIFIIIAFNPICNSCRPNYQKYCNTKLPGNVRLITNGEWFGIIHINDYQNQERNEFFTGEGFSSNKNDALLVQANDTCKFKWLYLHTDIDK